MGALHGKEHQKQHTDTKIVAPFFQNLAKEPTEIAPSQGAQITYPKGAGRYKITYILYPEL